MQGCLIFLVNPFGLQCRSKYQNSHIFVRQILSQYSDCSNLRTFVVNFKMPKITHFYNTATKSDFQNLATVKMAISFQNKRPCPSPRLPTSHRLPAPSCRGSSGPPPCSPGPGLQEPERKLPLQWPQRQPLLKMPLLHSSSLKH